MEKCGVLYMYAAGVGFGSVCGKIWIVEVNTMSSEFNSFFMYHKV